jgi:SAM-dependent methyltransferase
MSGALEQQSAQEALERLPEVERRVAALRRRLAPHLSLPAGGAVLDIGAALGLYVGAWTRAGFDAVGVEPWPEAVRSSADVGAAMGTEIKLVEGVAESLPFATGSFDLVVAISVLEHVEDPPKVFAEAARVLRPGGGFYLYTTSAICPWQAEIRLFPAFPWYPPPLRRVIMRWATTKHPWLVRGTTMPAYHWYTPWGARRALRAAGFRTVLDRWELRLDDENEAGLRGRLAGRAKRGKAAKAAANLVVPESAYLAVR